MKEKVEPLPNLDSTFKPGPFFCVKNFDKDLLKNNPIPVPVLLTC